MVVEEMVIERPIVEGTWAERFANEEAVLEGSVVENKGNKKIEVY